MGEPVTRSRLGSIAMILLGVACLLLAAGLATLTGRTLPPSVHPHPAPSATTR